jgi:NAD(P)H dehydrogenase (quinone)
MNILIVYAHPEPQSINGAMYRIAIEHLTALGHKVKTTDLYAMQFDPISSRKNFATANNPDFFKPQLEEMYATENNGFAAMVVCTTCYFKRLGRPRICHGPIL